MRRDFVDHLVDFLLPTGSLMPIGGTKFSMEAYLGWTWVAQSRLGFFPIINFWILRVVNSVRAVTMYELGVAVGSLMSQCRGVCCFRFTGGIGSSVFL